MKASFHKFTAALFAACLFTLFACSSDDGGENNPPIIYGPTVRHGGEDYQTVVIGNQTWFARNLNYDVSGSKCYSNDIVNCFHYGRLYNWETAMTACPSGWHLPTDAEWETLMNYAGGSSNAGKKLKAISHTDNGTNDYGFSALLGGSFSLFETSGQSIFLFLDYSGHWWSASEVNSDHAYSREMVYGKEYVNSSSSHKSVYHVSVRCLKN